MKLCAGRQPKFLAPGVCLLAFLSLPPMLAHLLFCRGLLAPQLLSGRVGPALSPVEGLPHLYFYSVISTEVMRSITEWRNLFKH